MSWLRTEGGAFWSVFVVAFLGVAVWESLRPRAELSESVERRWGKHSLLFLVSFVVSAVLVPTRPDERDKKTWYLQLNNVWRLEKPAQTPFSRCLSFHELGSRSHGHGRESGDNWRRFNAGASYTGESLLHFVRRHWLIPPIASNPSISPPSDIGWHPARNSAWLRDPFRSCGGAEGSTECSTSGRRPGGFQWQFSELSLLGRPASHD